MENYQISLNNVIIFVGSLTDCSVSRMGIENEGSIHLATMEKDNTITYLYYGKVFGPNFY
jgi:hypothetical protein